jgi:glutamate synthase domain-containing protein 2
MSFLRHLSLYHVDCDVGDCHAGLATANALARAHVNARRQGRHLRLVNASPELRELIAFLGLGKVLLGRSEGQPEEREEAFRVEERGEAGDPPV